MTTNAEEKVLAQIDNYLACCEIPPAVIRVYEKQATAVKRSRKLHSGPLHTTEYLEFTRYKGIAITIFEESTHD